MQNHTPQLPLFAIVRDDLPPIIPITSTRIKDLTGKRFGRLVVLGYAGNRNRWKPTWVCHCECGETFVTYGYSLTSGKTKSCGCFHREHLGDGRRSHGSSNTREYKIWQAMITRCENPSQPHYERYGGRGITVCPEWRHSFEQFITDMGPRPGTKHSLDRIDNDLGYSPENCRWATPSEQANNTRQNHYLELNGERLTIAQWAIRTGISRSTLHSRIRKGMSDEEILTMPVGWHWSHGVGPPAIPRVTLGENEERFPARESTDDPNVSE